MLFPEEDSELLKKWIINRLAGTSDADPDVLAEYMLALLRHDGEVNEVRALCKTEIPDFLKDGAAEFVQDVFDAIQYKSYRTPAAPPPARRSSGPHAPPTGPSAPMYNGLPGIPAFPSVPMGPHNGSRKRSCNDRGEGDGQDRGLAPGGDPNGRMFKQPRRGNMMGGTMGRGDFNHMNGRGGYHGRVGLTNMHGPQPPNFINMPSVPDAPPGMPSLDPNNPVAALLAMQQLQKAMGLPPISPVGQVPQQPMKQRCRDYDTKGFCARGHTCKYEHGTDPVFVPSPAHVDEYDPTTSLMAGVDNNGQPAINGMPPGPTFNFNGSRGNDRGRGRGGFQRGGGNDRGGLSQSRRAEFSSTKPNYDRSRMTIVVEQIPEEKFVENHVRAFFSEFGNITEVDMRPYKRLAIIKFETYDEAKSAYDSPKVIFDNRFVKVYWYIDADSLPQPPAKSKDTTKTENGAASAAQKPPEPVDPVKFAKKQEEIQKTHDEKLRKKQQVDEARAELDKKLAAQAEEKRQLMEKIARMTAKKNGSATPSQNGTPVPISASNDTQSEAQKLLSKLQAEAASLGIDPTLTPTDSWRGRSRGRGGYRGRATSFVPRGSRGGYRGRGGAPFAGSGSVYKIDNRPRKIGLKGVDFTAPGKDEPLREHLFGIDSTAEVDITPALTTILFKERYMAENFFASLPNGELPSVGKLELSWIQTPLAPVKPKMEDTAMTEEAEADEGDAMAATGEASTRYEQPAENFDYDVADDNDWGTIS
ncbi:hypothetical protein BJ878DRAFT_232407 [Calycina marina]|uniref:Uncharacterized protein n=1 Tax=Calycina marina TaxID=1763456 RepID=A0A9P8CH77_9HELO|nr:hypothetical protein BJ878DRAFT_232407 [Calycina marina]